MTKLASVGPTLHSARTRLGYVYFVLALEQAFLNRLLVCAVQVVGVEMGLSFCSILRVLGRLIGNSFYRL